MHEQGQVPVQAHAITFAAVEYITMLRCHATAGAKEMRQAAWQSALHLPEKQRSARMAAGTEPTMESNARKSQPCMNGPCFCSRNTYSCRLYSRAFAKHTACIVSSAHSVSRQVTARALNPYAHQSTICTAITAGQRAHPVQALSAPNQQHTTIVLQQCKACQHSSVGC